jgi:glycosyltransferase involved in cell wall biosynthesis
MVSEAIDSSPRNLDEWRSSPLVSVIISNYNYGRFLAEAIDSVLAQTYLNYELLVVDDGSTDDSRTVIESYGDRLSAFYQDNQGQTAAFNLGIKQAKGEIVCFLDADDYYHPDKLKQVVVAFQNHPAWVQISHYWMTVDAQGRVLPKRRKSLGQGSISPLLLRYGRYRSALTSALAYRRSVLQTVLPIPPRRGNADAYLMAVVPFYGEVGVLSEPLMVYRLHQSNLHAQNPDLHHHLQDRVIVMDYIQTTAKHLGLECHLDLNRDPEYRFYRQLQTTPSFRLSSLEILWLAFWQSFGIGHHPVEILARLLWMGGCLLFPGESKRIVSLGLRQYWRTRWMRQNVPCKS